MCAERPGTRRRSRPRQSSRPPARAGRARRANSRERSRNRPRGGAPPAARPGSVRSSERRRPTSLTWAGRSPAPCRSAATTGDVPAVERRDVRGLGRMQEVAGRVDASTVVRSPGSTRGPSVPGSSSQPAMTASSWSGTQSAVKTTRSQSTALMPPESSSVSSTSSTRSLPRIAVTAVRVRTGAR